MKGDQDIREHVDGASAADVFTEARQNASLQLRAAAGDLLPLQYQILRFVCGEGRSLNDLTKALAVRKGVARALLLFSLDRLAEIWNLGKPKARDDGPHR